MKFFRVSVCLFCLGFLGTVAWAQDTASITGTVHDSSGAIVPNADVTVSNATIGVTRSTATNQDGEYLVGALPAPGRYTLTVTATGFKKFEVKDVVLRVAQKARIDATLEVGTMTAEVVVAGQTVAQVDTASSEIAGTVTATQLSQLQLNGRNFTQLATLVPGVSNQTGQDEGFVGVAGNISFSFNGGRVEYNNWEIDGGDNMDNGSNDTLNVYPSLDAIQEVRVLASNYGAQYGRNGSGTVEVETKSGTRSFHGDAYEYLRNNIFNARNFFDQTIDAPPYHKHDFGYTIGGPVYIPKHYNTNKDKTFFFWSEEWRRESTPSPFGPIPVPSTAERSGNFSDLCPDPSGSMSDCPSLNGANPAAIPVDPNAQALLVLIPQPNVSNNLLCGPAATGCYAANAKVPVHWRQELVRVDHNINSKLRATFRYIHDSWEQKTAIPTWGNVCDTFPVVGWDFVGPGTSAVARLSAAATPTLLNEFVVSYTADHIFLTNIGPAAIPRSAASPPLTMTGLFPGFGQNLTGLNFSEAGGAYGGSFSSDPGIAPWNNANPTYTLRDNLSKLHGKHNFQTGVYVAAAQKNEQNSPDLQGLLNFASCDTSISTGNSFADFLSGRIASFQQWNALIKYYNRYKIVEPYFQDDWHITSRLTLNLGVRISLFGTYSERYRRAYNFDPRAYNAANAPAFNTTIGDGSLQAGTGNPFDGIVQCGGSGGTFTAPGGFTGSAGGNSNKGCLAGHLFNPAPRIGFAWDPWGNGKTAIRGGYGIFFEHSNGNEANTESLEGSAPLVLNPKAFNITGPCANGATGYECLGGGELFPIGPIFIPTKTVWPYVQQWNLSVQQELPQHFIAGVAYVGSKGTHLGLQTDLNQLKSLADLGVANPYKPGEAIGPTDCVNATGPNPTTPSGVPITGAALDRLNVACHNPVGGLSSFTPNPLRPFLGFGDITALTFNANSIYNSLQAAVRRTVGALNISANYTYSHAIDDSSDRFDNTFVDSYNLALTRGSSTFDQRHLFNFSYVYDLPFFSKSTGLAHKLLGGWTYSGITSVATGTPVSIHFNGFTDNAGVANGIGFGTFPDLVGDPNAAPPAACVTSATGPLLYNPCAFAAPQGLTFGNAGRSVIRIPRRTNFDMSVLKKFAITESTGFEFRTEAFNIFNHTQWNGIHNTFGSTNFLHPSGAHRARTLQFGLKFLF